jgi:hypothetical protein
MRGSLERFHTAAPAFPLADAFRRDVKHFSELGLDQRKFLPAQYDMQRLGSNGWVHWVYILPIDLNRFAYLIPGSPEAALERLRLSSASR